MGIKKEKKYREFLYQLQGELVDNEKLNIKICNFLAKGKNCLCPNCGDYAEYEADLYLQTYEQIDCACCGIIDLQQPQYNNQIIKMLNN
jgi:uncharacterized protein (DUF983 family)